MRINELKSFPNGTYMCQCIVCKDTFAGHKHQFICKECEIPKSDLKVFSIEYELPSLRAIYHCECDAKDEEHAKSIFMAVRPDCHIRKIKEDLSSKPVTQTPEQISESKR